MQAQDVMTTKVTTIEAGATVREAARRTLERRVSALPVVDDRGRVIGVVSEGDLVRRIATAPAKASRRTKSDRALRKAVLEEIKRARVDATYANVTVESGTVHLWGGLRTEVEQRALRAAARVAAGRRKIEDHTVVLPPLVVASLGAV